MKLFDFVIVILLLLGAAALVCAEDPTSRAVRAFDNPYRVQSAANPYTVAVADASTPWVQPHSTSIDPWPAIKAECLRTGKPVMVWVRFADRMAWQRMSGANHVHLDEDFWDREGPGVWVIRPWQGHCYAMGFVKADDCTDARLNRLAGLSVGAGVDTARPAKRVGGWGMSVRTSYPVASSDRGNSTGSPAAASLWLARPVQRAAGC